MRSTKKHLFFEMIILFFAAISCTATPGNTPFTQTSIIEQVSNTGANGIIAVTDSPVLTETSTVTSTPTITQTPTPPPDVELGQLQIDGTIFFAEIINNLHVPMVFEDQQPAFRFDVYDPKLDEHFKGEEPVDRYNDEAQVPCVLFPGETAFYAGNKNPILHDWQYIGGNSSIEQLKITYQSLGVPRPDWPEKTRKYKVSDLKWDVEGEKLYFSFKHTPYHVTYGHVPFSPGTMGLYDKDNHLLGVATGDIYWTIETGIADGYWVSFTNSSQGDHNKQWQFFGLEDAGSRVDHIEIMIEILQGVDGTCVKRRSTPTP
jgi:hypothetical protein